jgi:hypothetical protein
MKRYIFCLIILLLILTDGCRCSSKALGISSNSSGGDENPSILKPIIKVVIAENPKHPSDFIFTIDITGAVNTSGVSFTLNYDPRIIQVKDVKNPANSVKKGAFFEQGEAATGLGVGFYQNSDLSMSDSSLVVGLSRARGSLGITGSGTIMTFTFTTVGRGKTSVKFSETAADNSLFIPENPLESIPSVLWTNADITVK